MTPQNWWKTLAVFLAATVTMLIIYIGTMTFRVAAATPENILAQVRSVSQLSDVQPSDYYFQSLQSLIERYGVNVAYPDGTFRPYRAMTRGEFAILLNTALNSLVSKEITTKTSDLGTKEELLTLQKLADKLESEVESLRQSREGAFPNGHL
jgi:hypothetical protein